MDIKKLINRRNTKPWVQANETTNSEMYRDAFVKKHGGRFVKNGRVWFWEEMIDEEKQSNKLWLITRNDGVSFMFDNFMEFCRINNLSKSALYDVMHGRRKSHKGFVKVQKLI